MLPLSFSVTALPDFPNCAVNFASLSSVSWKKRKCWLEHFPKLMHLPGLYFGIKSRSTWDIIQVSLVKSSSFVFLVFSFNWICLEVVVIAVLQKACKKLSGFKQALFSLEVRVRGLKGTRIS